MPEQTADVAAPAAVMTVSPLKPAHKRLVFYLALLFALSPLMFIGDIRLNGVGISDLDATGFFFCLGVLPGAIGICYHVLLANTRRKQARELLERYYTWRNARPESRAQESVQVKVDEASGDPLGAVAASLFLTGIFLLIAVFAGYEAAQAKGAVANGVQGMMYAGLGAYVAVLYYMVSRLYANALSSRFLLTSALRTASAVVLGWVFGIVGVTAVAGAPAAGATDTLVSNAVLFLVGLFHNMAIEALRTRARRLFGATAFETDELPLSAVEGIDDTTAELLSEQGIATIQHLATAEPGELCDRTLLPMDRIVDWMDQALLIRYVKRNITVARTLGIRTATDLAMLHMRNDSALLGSLAEKTGLPPSAIDHMARELREEYLVALLYEIEEGRPFPASLSPTAAVDTPAAVDTTTTVGATDSGVAAATIPITRSVSASPAALQT